MVQLTLPHIIIGRSQALIRVEGEVTIIWPVHIVFMRDQFRYMLKIGKIES